VIDGTYLVYKSFYRTKKIRDRSSEVITEEHFVKIARNNFLRMVAYIKNKYNVQHMFIVFDPDGENFRNRLLPSYKSNRDEKPEELAVVKQGIYEFISAHNFAFQIADDFEGDDLIGSFIHKYPNEKIYVYSGDKDLGAVVTNNVSFLLENGRAANVDERVTKITMQNFHRHFPIPPASMADYKSLQGDKSDCIKGVDGLFRSQALHLLMEYGTIENFFETGQSHYLFSKFHEQKEKILINKKVASIIRDCHIGITKGETDISRITIPFYIAKKIGW
jgi:DNA polymerase I